LNVLSDFHKTGREYAQKYNGVVLHARREEVYFHFVGMKLIARVRGGGGLINGRYNSSGKRCFSDREIVSDYGSAGSSVNVLRLARSRDKPPEQTEPRKSPAPRAVLLTRAAPETNLPRAAASFVD